MSRQYDAKHEALKAYPDDRESAVRLFIDYIGIDEIDIVYELGITCEEYIFGKEGSNG